MKTSVSASILCHTGDDIRIHEGSGTLNIYLTIGDANLHLTPVAAIALSRQLRIAAGVDEAQPTVVAE